MRHMTAPVCRPATKADIPLLQEAEALCFPRDPWSLAQLASHMDSAVGRAWIIEAEGALCAYLLASVIPPEGEVFRIATLPLYRQKGYARRLLSAFLADIPLCYLEVRASNLAARRLYESLGFIQTGVRPDYYQNPTEDACLYKKNDDTHIRL